MEDSWTLVSGSGPAEVWMSGMSEVWMSGNTWFSSQVNQVQQVPCSFLFFQASPSPHFPGLSTPRGSNPSLCFFQRAKGALQSITAGQKVISKHKNGRFYQCEVVRLTTETFYEVNFDDGSFSDNLYPEDIVVMSARHFLGGGWGWRRL